MALPAIKEPSYFFSAENCDSDILESLLSNGNYFRGEVWFKGLFPDCKQSSVMADLSTQYWLYPEQVIENVLEKYRPKFIFIKRPRIDQLISYVSHMRRGHIGGKSIGDICVSDKAFFGYLERMANWNDDLQGVRKSFPDVDFIESTFETLVSRPLEVLGSVVPDLEEADKIKLDVHKNPASYPRLELLNRLLFSNSVRKAGRLLPQKFYSLLINCRKRFVRLNLKEGESRHFDADKAFIENEFN